MSSPGSLKSILRLFGQHFIAPERKRLAAEVSVLSARFSRMTAGKNVDKLEWASAARGFLEAADRERRDRDLDAGWKYVHEASRQMIDGLTDSDLAAAVLAKRQEAEAKLAGWRREAVRALLATPAQARSSKAAVKIETRTALRQATALLDEATDNTYFKMRVVRRQMAFLSFTLLVLTIAFVLILACTDAYTAMRGSRLATAVAGGGMILGGMAACLSGLISFAQSSPEQRIPAHLANVTITLLRPVIGGVSALAAMLFLDAGILNLSAGISMWVVAFAFGFSERLIVGALDNLGSRSKEK